MDQLSSTRRRDVDVDAPGRVESTPEPLDADDSPFLRIRRRLGGLVTVVAIGSIPMLVLEFQREHLVRSDQMLIDVVNVVVLVVFSVDYVLGLATADQRGRYLRDEWLELLLVLSQVLVLFPTLAAFGILRALRATRIIRVAVVLARVVAIGGIASREGRRALRERAFSFALGLAGITWLTSAVAFTMVEDVGVDGRIPSFYDGLWWSLSTVTTVGYGDVAPVTAAGRVVGGITMLIGISVFAIITARIAEFFLSSETAD